MRALTHDLLLNLLLLSSFCRSNEVEAREGIDTNIYCSIHIVGVHVAMRLKPVRALTLYSRASTSDHSSDGSNEVEAREGIDTSSPSISKGFMINS